MAEGGGGGAPHGGAGEAQQLTPNPEPNPGWSYG